MKILKNPSWRPALEVKLFLTGLMCVNYLTPSVREVWQALFVKKFSLFEIIPFQECSVFDILRCRKLLSPAWVSCVQAETSCTIPRRAV